MALSRIRHNVKVPQEARITKSLLMLALGSWDRDPTF